VINAPSNFDSNELDFENIELEIKYLTQNEDKKKNEIIEFSDNKHHSNFLKNEEIIGKKKI